MVMQRASKEVGAVLIVFLKTEIGLQYVLQKGVAVGAQRVHLGVLPPFRFGQFHERLQRRKANWFQQDADGTETILISYRGQHRPLQQNEVLLVPVAFQRVDREARFKIPDKQVSAAR